MRKRKFWLNIIGVILFCITACTVSREPITHTLLRTSKDHRVLVLAVSFPDVDPTISISKIRSHVLDKTAKYYNDVSYGKISIIGDVKGWYRLPHPLDKYKLSPYIHGPDNRNNRSRIRRLVKDTFNAAEKDVTYANYYHIIIVVGVRTGARSGYGMTAYCANPGFLSGTRYGTARMEKITTQGGQRFKGGIIVVAQNAHPGMIVHDLAHAMGGVLNGKRVIPDLYSFELYDKALDEFLRGQAAPLSPESYDKFTAKFTVFVGPWDIMSRHIIKYRQPLARMSSFTRLRMGWIEDHQVVVLSPSQRRLITLSPVATGEGILVVKIPGHKKTYHLLENRQKVRNDRMIPSTGLLVLKVDESRQDGDGIVRIVDANPKVPNFGAATYGVEGNQNPSVNLKKDGAVEVLWQEGKDLIILVTSHSNDSEIRKMAKHARETYARSGVKEAKDLLMKMGLNFNDY